MEPGQNVFRPMGPEATTRQAIGDQPHDPSVPERIVEEIVIRQFPSGRSILFGLYHRDSLDLRRMKISWCRPALSCGDIPLSPETVHECQQCMSLICELHAVLCAGCGTVVCSRCVDWLSSRLFQVFVCYDCARRARYGPIRRFLCWLWSLVWGGSR